MVSNFMTFEETTDQASQTEDTTGGETSGDTSSENGGETSTDDGEKKEGE